MTAEQVHPMVMKAARGLCREVARQMDESDSELWAHERDNLILAAHAALTECGALAVLEVLGASERAQTNADADAAHMLAHHAITKVYGSAPE